MKKFGLMIMALSMLSLTACDTLSQAGNKEKFGAATGAVVGGLLGSKVGGGSGQLWATGIGVLLGGLVGSEAGRSLDKADMVYAQRANNEAHSAPIGDEISWNNPETGNSGAITPVRDGSDTGGRYCREYQQTIYVGGQQETGYGIACEQPDGSWEIVS
jgi:surface antigen